MKTISWHLSALRYHPEDISKSALGHRTSEIAKTMSRKWEGQVRSRFCSCLPVHDLAGLLTTGKVTLKSTAASSSAITTENANRYFTKNGLDYLEK